MQLFIFRAKACVAFLLLMPFLNTLSIAQIKGGSRILPKGHKAPSQNDHLKRSHLLHPDTSIVYNYTEEMPDFGMDVDSFLNNRLQYPDSAIRSGIGGRPIINFVIAEDGSVTAATIRKSSGYPLLDEEALRVVLTMPKWKPGKKNGKAVKTYFSKPVLFQLE